MSSGRRPAVLAEDPAKPIAALDPPGRQWDHIGGLTGSVLLDPLVWPGVVVVIDVLSQHPLQVPAAVNFESRSRSRNLARKAPSWSFQARLRACWTTQVGRAWSRATTSAAALSSTQRGTSRRGLPWGRCEVKTGIPAFSRLVDQVMAMEPYRSAPRVFWIVDNGSSHHGRQAAERLQALYPYLILVHTPTHAS